MFIYDFYWGSLFSIIWTIFRYNKNVIYVVYIYPISLDYMKVYWWMCIWVNIRRSFWIKRMLRNRNNKICHWPKNREKWKSYFIHLKIFIINLLEREPAILWYHYKIAWSSLKSPPWHFCTALLYATLLCYGHGNYSVYLSI